MPLWQEKVNHIQAIAQALLDPENQPAQINREEALEKIRELLEESNVPN